MRVNILCSASRARPGDCIFLGSVYSTCLLAVYDYRVLLPILASGDFTHSLQATMLVGVAAAHEL